MSDERPSKSNRMRKITGCLKRKVSSLLHLSRAPSPSSIERDSRSDNPTRWVTKFFSSTRTFHWNSLVFLRTLPRNVVPAIGPSTTAFTTEVFAVSPGAPISVPLIDQLGSESGRGFETLPTVSDYAALIVVFANYWLFSISLRSAVVHYRPLHLTQSKRSWN